MSKKTQLLASFPDMGVEAWARWDADCQVWEVCAKENGEGYFGCADTIREAKTFAREWFEELMA
jgi:hypothetical protein